MYLELKDINILTENICLTLYLHEQFLCTFSTHKKAVN